MSDVGRSLVAIGKHRDSLREREVVAHNDYVGVRVASRSSQSSLRPA
jgi:hypothetical protein